MIKPIKLGCTPILPTAYGDALSYYEEICKLSEKMNEIISDINDNLDSYIKNNFNDIMVESTYDEDNEMIILSSNITATGDTHAYADKTIIIK